MTGIYKIENLKNGKIYFGQAIDFEKRKDAHIRALNGGYHRNRYLQASWNKYGSESFRFTFVEECDESRLSVLEIEYISANDTVAPHGYNLTTGGEGVRGLQWSEESRQRLSNSRRGVKTGRKVQHAPETLAKMSASMKIRWQDETYRTKSIKSRMGQKRSQETKDKMSQSRRGRVQSNARKVICVETGVIYPSVKKVDIGRKIYCSQIYRADKSGGKAYGYHWKLL